MGNTTKKGREYEIFVAGLYRALLDSEKHAKHKNISIERNKKLKDRHGVEREFDIYWEYELMGHTFKTVVECKDYSSLISMEKLDAFHSKISSIPTSLKGIFATRVGYQSGVLGRLRDDTIELLIIREQNDSDWTDSNGNPLIKVVEIKLILQLPARILYVAPALDSLWMNKHHGMQVGERIEFSGPSDKTFIENDDDGTRVSLHEVESTLKAPPGESHGRFQKRIDFTSGWLIVPKAKYKLRHITLHYEIHKPLQETLEIDFSRELNGVIEYLNRREKKLIFNQGIKTRKLRD